MLLFKIKFYLIFASLLCIVILHLRCNSNNMSINEEFQLGDDDQKTAFNNVSKTHLSSNNLNSNTMDGQAFDIDNDGDLDMILAMEFRRNVILINDGSGVLKDESNERFPNAIHDSEDIAIADFDNDGDMDIIFVSEDDKTNEYYKNDGNGFFSDVSNLIIVKGISNVVETTDFNNDSFPDLIIGNQGQNFLLINNGNGEFIHETSTRLPLNNYTTQDIELKDIDNDGDIDIIEANETFNRILVNNGSGNFTDESELRLPIINDQTREVELADIDNDGDLDIFFANVDFGGIGNPQNRLLINDGKGFYTEITNTALPINNFRTVGAIFFDINNDGFIDILSGNRFNNLDNIVLINDQNNKFIDQTKTYFPDNNSYTFNFELADFNADGLKDLYMCNFRGKDILLFRDKD